jgi:molybdate transport system substrate-binding protein
MRSLSLKNPQQRLRLPLERFGATGRQARLCLLSACLLLAWVALAGCQPGKGQQAEQSGELIVFAAASLTEAFDDMARQFELENPGLTVVLNLAGSQQLAHQLSQGAPADVFASADQEQMAAAIAVGRVKKGSQQRFATNELALITPVDNPAGLRTLSDLARPGLKLILAAPEVPVGHYAGLFLDATAADPGFGPIFREQVLANVVSYEENVRAVLSKVRLGEADAGIVYRSDVRPGLDQEISQITIPQQLNLSAAYVIAPLANSQQPDLARRFIDFVLSPQGQERLIVNGLKGVASG